MSNTDKNRDKNPDTKESFMTQNDARGRILLIESGKDGIVAVDHEVRELERRADSLRRKADLEKVAIENMRASGILGSMKVFLGGAQAGLDVINSELESLIAKIHEKSAKVYRGIIDIDNIVDRYISGDRHCKMEEVVQISLGKVAMMASLYLKAVQNAQLKIEGALNAGVGMEAALMVGADMTLEDEKYNKQAADALQIVKINGTSLHSALREYSSHLDESPEWRVNVAIDTESILNVDVLTKPEYMDVYTPKKLEELKSQLLALHEAIKTVIEQVQASSKKLQEKKNAYVLAKKNKLCEHIFDDDDKEYHKKRAQRTWSGEHSEENNIESEDENASE